jgi:hypothetical protein
MNSPMKTIQHSVLAVALLCGFTCSAQVAVYRNTWTETSIGNFSTLVQTVTGFTVLDCQTGKLIGIDVMPLSKTFSTSEDAPYWGLSSAMGRAGNEYTLLMEADTYTDDNGNVRYDMASLRGLNYSYDLGDGGTKWRIPAVFKGTVRSIFFNALGQQCTVESTGSMALDLTRTRLYNKAGMGAEASLQALRGVWAAKGYVEK